MAPITASPAVIPALAAAFEHATGTLADRLLAGLEGAEAAGGDFRGREAGAILVVAHAGDDPLQRVSDVRVAASIQAGIRWRRRIAKTRRSSIPWVWSAWSWV